MCMLDQYPDKFAAQVEGSTHAMKHACNDIEDPLLPALRGCFPRRSQCFPQELKSLRSNKIAVLGADFAPADAARLRSPDCFQVSLDAQMHSEATLDPLKHGDNPCQ